MASGGFRRARDPLPPRRAPWYGRRVFDDRDTALIEESRRIRDAGSRVVADSAALIEASRAIGLHHAALARRAEQLRAARPERGGADPLP